MSTIIRAVSGSHTFPLSPRGRLWFDRRGSQLRGRRWRGSSSGDLLAFPLGSLMYRAPTRPCWLWGSVVFDGRRRGRGRQFWQRRLFAHSQYLSRTETQRKKLEQSYLGCPIRGEFTSSTMFGLDSHQFGNLTEEHGRQISIRVGSDAFGSLLESPSLVPELSNLVQKDPDFASKSLREIIDISAFDGSASRARGRGIKTRKPTLAARHWHCRGLARLC